MKKRDVDLKVLEVKQKGQGVETHMVAPMSTEVTTDVQAIPAEPVVKPELTGEAKALHEKAAAGMTIIDRTHDGLRFNRRGREIREVPTLEAKPGFIPVGNPTKVTMG